MIVFGAGSLASSYSSGLTSLIGLRFATGLGLGGAMPMTITLASEFCPSTRRSSLVTLMFCGFTLGSAVGGLIAAAVLPHLGWRVLLVGGGLAPLALAPVLGVLLPESVRFLVTTGNADERIAAILARVAPTTNLRGVRFVDEPTPKASPVVQLFGGGLLRATLLLWLAFFMSLLVVYLMTNWMPTLLQQASGASIADAAFIGAMYQVGGTIGAIVVGWLMDRFEPHVVLFVSYLAGAACIVLISLSDSHARSDDAGGICCWCVYLRRPGWRQRALSGALSDCVSRDWCGMGQRHRPQRLDRRVAPGRCLARIGVAGNDGLRACGYSGRHCSSCARDARHRASTPRPYLPLR